MLAKTSSNLTDRPNQFSHELVESKLAFGKDVNTETEEYPLFRAVT
jgi:hypothetical protein